MFTKTSATESMLTAEIEATLVKMKDLTKESAEYGKMLEHVIKLHKLKAEEKPKKVTPDTALIVTANIVGIVAILNHERLHPITSKAMAFVAKPW